jgi:hypothetical protein
MKTIGIAVASSAFTVGAIVTFLILRFIQSDMAYISLIAGAIIGTQAGLVWYHRQPGASLTLQLKLRLGAVLTITGVVLSLIMQTTIRWFQFPEVSILIGAVGCFIFPFVLAETVWKALEKRRHCG